MAEPEPSLETFVSVEQTFNKNGAAGGASSEELRLVMKPPSSEDEDELIPAATLDPTQSAPAVADEGLHKLKPAHRAVVSFSAIDTERTQRGDTRVHRVCAPGGSQLRRTSSMVLGSVRRLVQLKGDHKFDTSTLDKDIFRVFGHLKERFGEEYALHIVFTIRTAEELHRAWHMTLLTAKLMNQLKDAFNLVMTWELGVLRLKFRIEDGDYELHRKVPYDYDSEFQDKYMRVATALIAGSIDVNQALTYQSHIGDGKHTAKSGLFLRGFPGRLVLYPLVAATCAMIFFGGDMYDGGVAAVCGIASGLIEMASGYMGMTGKVTLDVIVGVSTGVIAGLAYNIIEEPMCLSAILMGTLYWFFYGTAFVIGLLEIIAGELDTGTTRFIAVSVKTFVLCLGSAFGLMITMGGETHAKWLQQADNCGCPLGPVWDGIPLDEKWWRIPLYLLCSAAVLGQYRLPIRHYWRGLVVQLVAYEVQYELQKYFGDFHTKDNMDYAVSNTVGAAAAVLAACILSFGIATLCHTPYQSRVLHEKGRDQSTKCQWCCYTGARKMIKLTGCCRRKSDLIMLQVEKKMRAAADPTRLDVPAPIRLEEHEEQVLLETIVESEDHNVWAVLMPAVYQLVPGSMIAKLWFNSIFPPPMETCTDVTGMTNSSVHEDFCVTNGGVWEKNPVYEAESNVFANLMVISTSLALGLILGFGLVHAGEKASTFWICGCTKKKVQGHGTKSLVPW